MLHFMGVFGLHSIPSNVSAVAAALHVRSHAGIGVSVLPTVPGTGHSVMAMVVKKVRARDSRIALRPQSGICDTFSTTLG